MQHRRYGEQPPCLAATKGSRSCGTLSLCPQSGSAGNLEPLTWTYDPQ